MREFSEFEKKVIKELVAANERSSNVCGFTPQNVFVKIIPPSESIMKIDSQDKNCYLIILDETKKDINIKKFYQIVFLLKFLEHNRYISILNINQSCLSSIDCKKDKVHPTMDESLKEYVNNLFQSVLFIHQDLYELIKNDFKIPEQIRFERQLNDAGEKHSEAMDKATKQVNYAIAAFVVSIIGLISAIVIPIIFNTTKLHEDSLQKIDSVIQQNRVVVPTTIDANVINDTLKVDIIQKQPAQIKK